jgi:hypothetical protein
MLYSRNDAATINSAFFISAILLKVIVCSVSPKFIASRIMVFLLENKGFFTSQIFQEAQG